MKNDPHLITAHKSATESVIKGLFPPTLPISYKVKCEKLSLNTVSYDKKRKTGHHIFKLILKHSSSSDIALFSMLIARSI